MATVGALPESYIAAAALASPWRHKTVSRGGARGRRREDAGFAARGRTGDASNDADKHRSCVARANAGWRRGAASSRWWDRENLADGLADLLDGMGGIDGKSGDNGQREANGYRGDRHAGEGTGADGERRCFWTAWRTAIDVVHLRLERLARDGRARMRASSGHHCVRSLRTPHAICVVLRYGCILLHHVTLFVSLSDTFRAAT